MPQQQFGGGDFIPMSGVPERVGLPIEEIQKTGAELTDRYYKAKGAYFNIDTTIKNKQLFDPSVDQKVIDGVNAHIASKFKDIIESDRWDQAAGTVMEVSRDIMTDKGLQGIDNAVATMKARTDQYEKRAEKDPTLRLGEARMRASAQASYRANGGGTDAAGNIIPLGGEVPLSDLNIQKYKDAISKNVALLEKVKSFQTTTGKVDMRSMMVNFTPEEQAALQKMERTTKGFESLTKDRILATATSTVKDDPMYAQTLSEVTKAELYNSTGKLTPDVDILKQMFHNNNSLEKQMSITSSPTYISSVKALENNYIAGMSHAKTGQEQQAITNAFNTAKAKIANNENIYKEGKDILYNKLDLASPEVASSMYYTIVNGNLDQSIKHSSDDKAYVSQISENTHDINTDTIAKHTLDKIAKDTNQVVSIIPGGSLPVENHAVLFDSNNPVMIDYKSATDKYQAILNDPKSTPSMKESAKHAYDQSTGVMNDKINSLKQAYSSMTKDEKESVLNSAGHILGAKGWDMFSAGFKFQSPEEKAKDIARINEMQDSDKIHYFGEDQVLVGGIMKKIGQVGSAISNIAGWSKEDSQVKHILRSMPSEEILGATTQQLISKYGQGLKFTPASIQLLEQKVDKYKFDMANAIAKSPKLDIIKGYNVQHTYGAPSVQETNYQLGVAQSVLTGNGIDVTTGMPLFKNGHYIDAEGKDLGRVQIKDNNAKTFDVNDLNTFSVGKVYKDGANDTGNASITFNVLDDKGHISNTYTKIVHVPGVEALESEAVRTNLVGLGKGIIKGDQSAMKSAVTLVGSIGNSMTSKDGRNFRDIEQSLTDRPGHTQTFDYGDNGYRVAVLPTSTGLMTYKILKGNTVVKESNGSTAIGNLHTLLATYFDNSIDPTVGNFIINTLVK